MIVAHKPTSILDKGTTESVLHLFREFVENRGVFMPSTEPLVHRRKRTIFFTAKSPEVAARAHQIFKCHQHALWPIDTRRLNRKERVQAIKKAFSDFEPSGLTERLAPPPGASMAALSMSSAPTSDLGDDGTDVSRKDKEEEETETETAVATADLGSRIPEL